MKINNYQALIDLVRYSLVTQQLARINTKLTYIGIRAVGVNVRSNFILIRHFDTKILSQGLIWYDTEVSAALRCITCSNRKSDITISKCYKHDTVLAS